jgi:hypothetical protein
LYMGNEYKVGQRGEGNEEGAASGLRLSTGLAVALSICSAFFVSM